MQRSQFIAAFVLLAVVAGFITMRFAATNDSASDEASGASDQAETGPAVASPDPGSTGTDSTGADSTGTDGAAQEGAEASSKPEEISQQANAPERLGPAGDLVELDGWLQTDATNFSDFDGQVKVVQFWTFGCFNCKNTIPHLQEIYAAHEGDGLEIIGVHTPEFDYEKDPDAIAVAAADLGVTWPIALDTNKQNFRAWQPNRRFWPRTFVVDQQGEVRFEHIGEGAYDELAATVSFLLENGP